MRSGRGLRVAERAVVLEEVRDLRGLVDLGDDLALGDHGEQRERRFLRRRQAGLGRHVRERQVQVGVRQRHHLAPSQSQPKVTWRVRVCESSSSGNTSRMRHRRRAADASRGDVLLFSAGVCLPSSSSRFFVALRKGTRVRGV